MPFSFGLSFESPYTAEQRLEKQSVSKLRALRRFTNRLREVQGAPQMSSHSTPPVHQAMPLRVASLLVMLILFSRPLSGQEFERFALVDQWPDADSTGQGILDEPISLDVAQDGRIFISDRGVGVVHVLDPLAGFQSPIGGEGTGQERLVQPGELALDPRDPDSDLYVLDNANERVVVFEQDGSIVTAWGNVIGTGIALDAQGRILVADRGRNQVLFFTKDGTEIGGFGHRGTEEGQFSDLQDLSVDSESGELVVADRAGHRIQVFQLGDTPSTTTHVRSYDLDQARYRSRYRGCLATTVHALGDESVWLGQGSNICIATPDSVEFVGASTYLDGTVCQPSLGASRVRPSTGDFIVVGDLNQARFGCSRPPVDEWRYVAPILLDFESEYLRSVRTSWLASSGQAQSSVLISPSRLVMLEDDTLLVQDTSPLLKQYDQGGRSLDALPSFGYPSAGSFQRLEIEAAVILPESRDIVALYRLDRRGWRTPDEVGIGRFQVVERRLGGGSIEVAEAVWTRPWVAGSKEYEPIELAVDHVESEALVLVTERIPALKTQTGLIQRHDLDTGLPKDDWELPSQNHLDGHTDLYVNVDGLVYVLDELGDVVRELDSQGESRSVTRVAHDARQVAGSAEHGIFVLRESGFIEGLESSGSIASRFDGRPYAGSNPSTLRDIAVDRDGRVYTVDGQSGVVSIFAPSSTHGSALVLPSDESCVFQAQAHAAPEVIELGEQVDVLRQINGRCGPSEEPSDIMIVAPTPGVANDDAMITWLKQDLQRLVSRIDFGRHRAGLLTYQANINRAQLLTSDREDLLDSIWRLRGIMELGADARSRIFRLDLAIRTARTLLNDDQRRRVIVLYYPLFCNRDLHQTCGGWRDPFPEADRAIQDGMQVIIFRPTVETWAERRNSFYEAYQAHPTQAHFSPIEADHLASSDEDVIQQDFSRAFRRIVRHDVPITPARDLVITDTMQSVMNLVPGSVVPPAASEVGRDLRWELPDLALGRVELRTKLRPQAIGAWPVSEHTSAELMDARGRVHHIDIPIPQVRVEAASVPTASPTPELEASPTPRPTDTTIPTEAPQVELLYLPWLSNPEVN